MLLGILASASLILLAYELHTLTTAVLWPLISNPSALQTDFHYYYEAAARFAADRNRLYNPADDFIAGFAYPPLAILPFMLLLRLPSLGVALLCLTVISYAAIVGAAALWQAHLRANGIAIGRKAAAAMTLIAVALAPTYSNAVFGQVNALVLLACVAFLVLAPRAPIVAGVLLAIGSWLKIYPLLVTVAGAWDARARKAVMSAAVAAAVLLVLALPIVPWPAHRAFARDVLPARIDKTAIHVTNQSLVAFLERFRFAPPGYLQWTGEQAITVGAAVRGINLLAGIGALALLWRRTASRHSEAVDSAAILMALVAVLAPLGWGHTYVLVIPLVMLRLAQLEQLGRIRAIVVFCCVGALMIPAGRVFGFAAAWPGWLQNLIYSRYLIATVLLAAMQTPTPSGPGGPAPAAPTRGRPAAAR